MLGILINIVGYVDLSQATSVTPVPNQICQKYVDDEEDEIDDC